MTTPRIRMVPLDRFLISELVENERDPLISEMASGPEFEARVMLAASYGNAYAVFSDGVPIAAGGLQLQWPGRAEAWGLFSRHIRRRHFVPLIQHVNAYLDRRQRDPSFRRIEMYVRVQPEWNAVTFAHALGFLIEGEMPRWDPAGRTYLICSRIREVC